MHEASLTWVECSFPLSQFLVTLFVEMYGYVCVCVYANVLLSLHCKAVLHFEKKGAQKQRLDLFNLCNLVPLYIQFWFTWISYVNRFYKHFQYILLCLNARRWRPRHTAYTKLLYQPFGFIQFIKLWTTVVFFLSFRSGRFLPPSHSLSISFHFSLWSSVYLLW